MHIKEYLARCQINANVDENGHTHINEPDLYVYTNSITDISNTTFTGRGFSLQDNHVRNMNNTHINCKSFNLYYYGNKHPNLNGLTFNGDVLHLGLGFRGRRYIGLFTNVTRRIENAH